MSETILAVLGFVWAIANKAWMTTSYEEKIIKGSFYD